LIAIRGVAMAWRMCTQAFYGVGHAHVCAYDLDV